MDNPVQTNIAVHNIGVATGLSYILFGFVTPDSNFKMEN